MLQSPWKTLGFKKSMVFKIPPGGKLTISSQWPILIDGEDCHRIG